MSSHIVEIRDIPQPKSVRDALRRGELDEGIRDLVMVLNGVSGIYETCGSCHGKIDSKLHHPYPWVTFLIDDENMQYYMTFLQAIESFESDQSFRWVIRNDIASLEVDRAATDLSELDLMRQSASQLAHYLFTNLVSG